MAASQAPTIITLVAGATFSTNDIFKLVHMNSAGQAIIATSSDTLAVGSLYGSTPSTAGTTASQSVPVAVQGVVKVQLVSSTKAAPNWIAGSSDGFGIAPTSELQPFGQIVRGSSGGAGRVVDVLVTRFQLTTGAVLAGG